MIARDLMNSDFPYVTADADLDYVAKLLAECGLGAVPVVDDELTPIGIVTRSNLEQARPQPLPDLGAIPGFLLRNRPKPVFHCEWSRVARSDDVAGDLDFRHRQSSRHRANYGEP